LPKRHKKKRGNVRRFSKGQPMRLLPDNQAHNRRVREELANLGFPYHRHRGIESHRAVFGLVGQHLLG